MLIKTLRKFISNPVSYIKLVYLKVFIYPEKYRKGKNDYDAEKYWEGRFKKYGLNIKGAGDEGDSEKNNINRYVRITTILKNTLQSNIEDFKNINVLEIGTGTGLITNSLNELGIINYTGIDITNILFKKLQTRFPDYKFIKLDITKDSINDKYDLIVLIDVIEHIVDRVKFSFAMRNLRESIKENGFIAIAPIYNKSSKVQFYEKHWSLEDLKMYLPDLQYLFETDWGRGISKFYLLRAI